MLSKSSLFLLKDLMKQRTFQQDPNKIRAVCAFLHLSEEGAVFLGRDPWNVTARNLQASECFEPSQKNPRAKTKRNATKQHPF